MTEKTKRARLSGEEEAICVTEGILQGRLSVHTHPSLYDTPSVWQRVSYRDGCLYIPTPPCTIRYLCDRDSITQSTATKIAATQGGCATLWCDLCESINELQYMNFMSDQACTPLGRVRWDGFCWDGLCCLGTDSAALGRVWDGLWCLGASLGRVWDGFWCLGAGLRRVGDDPPPPSPAPRPPPLSDIHT